MTKKISRYTRFLYWIVYQLGTLQAFILVVLIREPVWRSHDGRVRRLRDLSDAHLRNAAKRIMRDQPPDPVAYLQINLEQRRRGNESVEKHIRHQYEGSEQ